MGEMVSRKEVDGLSIVRLNNCWVHRFHNKWRFNNEASSFFQTFLETKYNWMAQNRFAGPKYNCGFYFSTDKDVLLSEILYYYFSNIKKHTTETIKDSLHKHYKSHVLLSVKVTINNLLDLTDPSTLRQFILIKSPSPKEKKWVKRAHVLDLMRSILSKAAGGNQSTNWLGWTIKENGYNGVVFPSVRCLEELSSIHMKHSGFYPRFFLESLRRIHAGDEAGLVDSILRQMYDEPNIVLFSGSLLSRSISEYYWADEYSQSECKVNIFNNKTAKELEIERLSLKNKLKLTSIEAVEDGLLTDSDILNEFDSEWLSFYY